MLDERQEAARWHPATRVAFRFVFIYFFLNFIPRAVGWLPSGETLLEPYFDFWDAVVVRVYEDVLKLPHEIDFAARRPGNSTYGWVLFLCYLFSSAVITVIWSVLDRGRSQYARLHQGLRLVLRLLLGTAMIGYGALKAIPAQMISPPPLGTLQQRIGDLWPNHLLWWTMGASPPFESFTGLAELLGGVLLLLPRTTLLGALISAANMSLVFVLNMCYDIPVKLPSLQLLVMAVILVAPDLRRLADVLLFNRRVEPARVQPFFGRRWLDRVAHVLVFLCGLYAIGSSFQAAAGLYERFHPPRPPLYGLWSVEGFTRDGRDVPLFTDPDRWRLVTVGERGSFRVEQMAGASKLYKLDLDLEEKAMRLTPANPKGISPAAFTLDQPRDDLLILDGHLDGRRTRIRLRKAALIRRTSHWYSGFPG